MEMTTKGRTSGISDLLLRMATRNPQPYHIYGVSSRGKREGMQSNENAKDKTPGLDSWVDVW
jgi:hypothetical protein